MHIAAFVLATAGAILNIFQAPPFSSPLFRGYSLANLIQMFLSGEIPLPPLNNVHPVVLFAVMVALLTPVLAILSGLNSLLYRDWGGGVILLFCAAFNAAPFVLTKLAAMQTSLDMRPLAELLSHILPTTPLWWATFYAVAAFCAFYTSLLPEE